MKIKFYTPLSGIDDQAFGAATFGFVGSEDERALSSITFPEKMSLCMHSGTKLEHLW